MAMTREERMEKYQDGLTRERAARIASFKNLFNAAGLARLFPEVSILIKEDWQRFAMLI